MQNSERVIGCFSIAEVGRLRRREESEPDRIDSLEREPDGRAMLVHRGRTCYGPAVSGSMPVIVEQTWWWWWSW